MSQIESKDRRTKARIYDPLRAFVRGIDSNGKAFEEVVTLDNLSGAGFYMRLWRSVEVGARLFTLLEFPAGARVAVKGYVLRSEKQPDGRCGVAVNIQRYRILYWSSSS